MEPIIIFPMAFFAWLFSRETEPSTEQSTVVILD